jgi:hypothetical protein
MSRPFSDYKLSTKTDPISATFLRKDADLDAPSDYKTAGNFGLAIATTIADSNDRSRVEIFKKLRAVRNFSPALLKTQSNIWPYRRRSTVLTLLIHCRRPPVSVVGYSKLNQTHQANWSSLGAERILVLQHIVGNGTRKPLPLLE